VIHIHSNNRRDRATLGIGIALLLIALCFPPQFRQIYTLPAHTFLFTDEPQIPAINIPFITAKVNSQERRPDTEIPVSAFISSTISPITGHASIDFKLFGVIPLRTVQFDVLPPVKVIPGGQSIGASLHSRGVLVVGYSPVPAASASSVNPAKDAGIQVGDTILSINNTYMCTENQLAETIDAAGKKGRSLEVSLQRGDKVLLASLKPLLCPETGRYRIGLFVRDSASGVGTLSFYDPNSRVYGAIGHRITDSDTLQPVDAEEGNVVLASVQGIQRGTFGRPGEKIGVFANGDTVLGDVHKNTEFGIYGQLSFLPQNDFYPETIPVASRMQIQTGAAEILMVIEGNTVARFSIQIEKINTQNYPASKGLVIKVTDSRLLAKTGGIVQGMSGSPIIQNGKLIGAVTHVFITDPTKGYGCFADWMLMEGGLIPKTEKQGPFLPF